MMQSNFFFRGENMMTMEKIIKRRERQRRYYYNTIEKRRVAAREYQKRRYERDLEFRERQKKPIKDPLSLIFWHARRNYQFFFKWHPEDAVQTAHFVLASAKMLKVKSLKKPLISLTNKIFYQALKDFGYAKVNGHFIRRP